MEPQNSYRGASLGPPTWMKLSRSLRPDSIWGLRRKVLVLVPIRVWLRALTTLVHVPDFNYFPYVNSLMIVSFLVKSLSETTAQCQLCFGRLKEELWSMWPDGAEGAGSLEMVSRWQRGSTEAQALASL